MTLPRTSATTEDLGCADGGRAARSASRSESPTRYAGLRLAVDSLTLDSDTSGAVTVECGCDTLVRGRHLLRSRSSRLRATPYPATPQEGNGFGGLPLVSEYGFQQTRCFRALKIWSTLLLAAVTVGPATSSVGQHTHAPADSAPIARPGEDLLELLAPGRPIVVCFRYLPPAHRDRGSQCAPLPRAQPPGHATKTARHEFGQLRMPDLRHPQPRRPEQSDHGRSAGRRRDPS